MPVTGAKRGTPSMVSASSSRAASFWEADTSGTRGPRGSAGSTRVPALGSGTTR